MYSYQYPMVKQVLESTARRVVLTIRNSLDPLWTPNLSIISETWKPKPALTMAESKSQYYFQHLEDRQ